MGVYHVAIACNTDAVPQEVLYNKQDAPEWALSLIHLANGEPYRLTNIEGDGEVLGHNYQPVQCGDDSGDPPDDPDPDPSTDPILVDRSHCDVVTGNDDPLCLLPNFATCNACLQTINQPNQLRADGPAIFNAGDHAQRVIRFFGIKKKVGCRCDQRQDLMNKYGQRIGREIAKLIGLR